MRAAALVGCWALLDYRVRAADGGEDRFPLGRGATGRLIYTASGQVMAALSGDRRGGADDASLELAHRVPEAARAAWFDSYLSYAGRWRLDGDEVVHTLEVALVPSMVGREVRRRVALDGNRMALSYGWTSGAGRRYTFSLSWEHADDAG